MSTFTREQLLGAEAFLALEAARHADVAPATLVRLQALVLRLGIHDAAPPAMLERLRRHFEQHPVAPALLQALIGSPTLR